MAPKDLEKAQKVEADTLNNLGLIRDQATKVLDDPDRLAHSETIPRRQLSKLQLASEQYEASVKALLAVLEDEDQNKTYTAKLTKQLAGLDTFLKKLQDAVKNNISDDDTEIPV